MNRCPTTSLSSSGGVPHTRGDEPAANSGICEGKGVFPTPVGMNRLFLDGVLKDRRVPHTRGDEPVAMSDSTPVSCVFPTPVGMNRDGDAGIDGDCVLDDN